MKNIEKMFEIAHIKQKLFRREIMYKEAYQRIKEIVEKKQVKQLMEKDVT